MTDIFHDLPGQDAVVAQLRRAAAGAAAMLAGQRAEPGVMPWERSRSVSFMGLEAAFSVVFVQAGADSSAMPSSPKKWGGARLPAHPVQEDRVKESTGPPAFAPRDG